MAWGFSLLKKNIFVFKTVKKIILGLRRAVFYGGSNWLITMVGLQTESLQISDYQSLVTLKSLSVSRLFLYLGCLLKIIAKGKPFLPSTYTSPISPRLMAKVSE